MDSISGPSGEVASECEYGVRSTEYDSVLTPVLKYGGTISRNRKLPWKIPPNPVSGQPTNALLQYFQYVTPYCTML
jgi:hypothetical protein